MKVAGASSYGTQRKGGGGGRETIERFFTGLADTEKKT